LKFIFAAKPLQECVRVTQMDTAQLSVTLNIITGVLLIISELLGLSKCQANGILDLLISNLQCLKKQVDAAESMKEPSPQDHIVLSQLSSPS
jgi:hypothetical protein